ncbi:transcription factor Opi1-domain-containing protein [Podospora appendiculata]|uniref:Transcription factor Opi1-domain-containing protein n=1 Tax=Podospora appendiculata TaxID=314037 RepID=A0AAE0X724_9PEZI|nr:transcription factor Opi1-domain-containing protein [Podospora appendiculata]
MLMQHLPPSSGTSLTLRVSPPCSAPMLPASKPGSLPIFFHPLTPSPRFPIHHSLDNPSCNYFFLFLSLPSHRTPPHNHIASTRRDLILGRRHRFRLRFRPRLRGNRQTNDETKPPLHGFSQTHPHPPSQNHDPATLAFPDAPSTELPPIQTPGERISSPSNQTLPSLSTVTRGQPSHFTPHQQQQQFQPEQHWPSLNPFTAYYSPSHVQPPSLRYLDGDSSVASPERPYERRGTSVSLDDPDVRIAAQALGDLKADLVSSPPGRNTSGFPRDRQAGGAGEGAGNVQGRKPEPILTLITSQQLLAATFEGAMSAYNTGKNFSPHLRTGANYIEGYLSPVAKVVGSVGRRTGVEGSLRWILSSTGRKTRHASDLESGEGASHKRRRVKLTEKEIEAHGRTSDYVEYGTERRLSTSTVGTVDTLPAYDNKSSPAYTEMAERSSMDGAEAGSSSPQPRLERLVIMSSGLGVAMKEGSRHKLIIIIGWLRSTNERIAERVRELQALLKRYDAVAFSDGEDHVMGDSQEAASRSQLMASMVQLKHDIYNLIKASIDYISKHTRAVVPQNVAVLVTGHLKSLPGRYPWPVARAISAENQTGASPDQVKRDGFNVVLVFAQEGLETIAKVQKLLEGTLISAQEWVNSFNSGGPEQSHSPVTGNGAILPTAHFATDSFADRDVKMMTN